MFNEFWWWSGWPTPQQERYEMSTPTTGTVSSLKMWVALIGGLLTAILPAIVSVLMSLPEPWPALAGVIVAVATAFGVWRAPRYKKTTE